MATQTPVGGNGFTVSAPGSQVPSPATVVAAAAQYLVESAWRVSHPNQVYLRGNLGTVGGEG